MTEEQTAEYDRGARAFAEGTRYDPTETAEWRRGFGDAVTIKVAEELP